MKDRKDREIVRKSEEIQRLTIQLDTATVDRDYYRGQRDRMKEHVEQLDEEMRVRLQTIAELRQGMRQIIVAVESSQSWEARLDAILRIARSASGA